MPRPAPWTGPRIERGTRAELLDLCQRYHAYQGAGAVGQVFVVREGGRCMAALAFQPPAYGAAAMLAPSEPGAVSALSRMVAVPREQRDWVLSSLLREILDGHLDRTRYPVVATWSDYGVGHNGAVYRQAGMKRGGAVQRPVYELDGVRRAGTAGGGARTEAQRVGETRLRLWTDRVCPIGEEGAWMAAHGWRRVPVPGKTWRSGAPAHRWERVDDRQASLF